jgi:diaminopimelate epimerase
MKSGLVLEFTKMHGAGNDFIVIDNRFFRLSDRELSEIAAVHCRRQLAIGADGLLALNVPRSDDFDYQMRYFNADGSSGEMCGNGARCLAAFARDGGIDSEPLHFETDAGRYRAFVEKREHGKGPERVRLIVPGPKQVDLQFATIPVDTDNEANLAFMITGVPHAVWIGEGLASVPLVEWGSRIRHDACFEPTSGTNVDFVEIAGSDENGTPILKVRTYERGVEAETLACGTGALSSLVAAHKSGRIAGREAVVRMPGGDLRVGYVDGTDELYLEGPVAVSFRGSVVV